MCCFLNCFFGLQTILLLDLPQVFVTCEEQDRAPRDQNLNLDLCLVLAVAAWIPCSDHNPPSRPSACFQAVKTFVRVGGDHGWTDQTQCGTAQRRTHSCCRTATTTVRSAILPSLSRFSWNECSDRGFSSMQSGAKAQVHRQELWVWTGCEFHACSCTSFIP